MSHKTKDLSSSHFNSGLPVFTKRSKNLNIFWNNLNPVSLFDLHKEQSLPHISYNTLHHCADSFITTIKLRLLPVP